MSLENSVQEELQRRVAENRQLGRYPLGLEEQLEADFKAIMEVVHGSEDFEGFRTGELASLRDDLKTLKESLSTMRSRKPRAQIEDQLIELMERCVLVIETAHKEIAQIREEDTRVLRKMNSFILDRLVMVDVLAQAVVELERKLNDK